MSLQHSMIRTTIKLHAKYKGNPNKGMAASKNLGKDSLRREMPGGGF